MALGMTLFASVTHKKIESLFGKCRLRGRVVGSSPNRGNVIMGFRGSTEPSIFVDEFSNL